MEQTLYDAKIQLSAHTIDGWEGQFNRMVRYYNRSIVANDSTDELDYFIAFFQNCFHLKDWIIEINKNDFLLKKEIHDMIGNNKSMKICRDLCNGLKHLKINKPSIDKHFAMFLERRPWHKTDGVKENGWSIFISENNQNPNRYYLEEVAKNCLDAWIEFIKSKLKKHP